MVLTFYSATLLFLIDVWFIFIIGPAAFLEAFARAVFSLLCSLTYLFATVGVLVPNAIDICIKGRPLFGTFGCLCFFCCWCWITGCTSCPCVDKCCWRHQRKKRHDADFEALDEVDDLPSSSSSSTSSRSKASQKSRWKMPKKIALSDHMDVGDQESLKSFKEEWETERKLSWFATLRMASGAVFFAREAALCLAAAITLAIPFFGVLFVYHAWRPDGQYELSPIVTVLGQVDPRRFISIWDNCNGRFRGVSGAPFPGSL